MKPYRIHTLSPFMTSTPWIPNAKASQADIISYGDEIKRIGDTIDLLFRDELDEQKNRIYTQTLSISLRKLLLQDNLIRTTIQAPTYHKLLSPLNATASELTYSIKMLDNNNIYHSWEISSLPGFNLTEDMLWNPHQKLFALNTEPKLKKDNWLRQPLVKIIYPTQQNKLTLWDIIHHVAATEGAHVDNNPTPRRQKRLTKGEIYFLGDHQQFNYPHWIVTCVAIYLYNRQVNGILSHQDAWLPYMHKSLIPNTRTYINIAHTPNLNLPISFPTQSSSKQAETQTPNDTPQKYRRYSIQSAI